MRTILGYTLSSKAAPFLGTKLRLDNAVMPENSGLLPLISSLNRYSLNSPYENSGLVGEAQSVRARRLTLKQYLGFQHVLVEIREGQQALVDRALSQLGAKRHVALTLPFFVPAIFAIAQTDLILTVPRRLAEITAVMAGVRVVEAPREIKSFPYFMAWHPRLTNEPAHEWFREQLRSAVRTV
jgi:DNA-binding transcriptional LysR family regulator